MAQDTQAKPVVLVVEDDAAISQLLGFLFEKDGYTVHLARSGAAAVQLLKSLPPPTLVTLDISLPDSSGVELIVHIRSTPGWERVPIIMVTARPQGDEEVWAVEAGARAYLLKPFKPQELRDCVRRVLAQPAG